MAGDSSALFIEQIQAASAAQQRLLINGHNSKRQWLPAAAAVSSLCTAEHSGILQYEPAELVVTARAGTSLAEIDAALREQQQMLACEPPRFFASDVGTFGATLGGAVACGFSGPGRPWLGALRDAILGVELINGLGEYLKFGGQVMKNVAGYDVSRLQAGAWGALGVMSVISLRVQPCFAAQVTVSGELTAAAALDLCAQLGQRNLPITGSCWHAGGLALRLQGNESGVAAACAALAEFGLMPMPADDEYWQRLQHYQHDFFLPSMQASTDTRAHGSRRKLWRVVTPLAAPMPDFGAPSAADALVMWGGGLRWFYQDDAAAVMAYAKAVGGWCWAIGDAMPIDPMQAQIMHQLANAFDPKGVFATPLSFPANKAATLAMESH